MAFFENEGRQVRTFRVSFREMTRIFADLGGFNLGWHWLRNKNSHRTATAHKGRMQKSIRKLQPEYNATMARLIQIGKGEILQYPRNRNPMNSRQAFRL